MSVHMYMSEYKEISPRRMIYLLLKEEVAELIDSDEIIIVVASLTKYMNSQNDISLALTISCTCCTLSYYMQPSNTICTSFVGLISLASFWFVFKRFWILAESFICVCTIHQFIILLLVSCFLLHQELSSRAIISNCILRRLVKLCLSLKERGGKCSSNEEYILLSLPVCSFTSLMLTTANSISTVYALI